VAGSGEGEESQGIPVVVGRSAGTTRDIDIYRVRLDIYIHMYIRCGRVGGGRGISRYPWFWGGVRERLEI